MTLHTLTGQRKLSAVRWRWPARHPGDSRDDAAHDAPIELEDRVAGAFHGGCGKPAHCIIRWLNSRGETGPWRETATATIGA